MDEYRTEILPEPEENIEERKKNRSGCVSFAIDTLETVLLALVLFFAINAVSARVRVDNISMQPTLKAGEFLLLNRLAYRTGEPVVGDIVVFHYPGDPKEDYIKRVIGTPGDQVDIANGKVRVNGQELTEPYIAEAPMYAGTWTVPEDSLFVLGDNRNQSSDSHSWGFVPMKNVVGKALLIYWPPSQMRILSHTQEVQAAP
ncbi:MAG: signal peptidase I [Anaerolineaceae bacterium]